MKTTYRTLLTTLLLATTSVATAGNVLIISMRNGAEQTYNIQEPMRIHPTTDSLIITSEHICVAYSRQNVRNYHFETEGNVVDKIENITTNNNSAVKFTREGSLLTIKGLREGSRIQVFATNSIQQSPRISYTDGSAFVDFSSLPQGVYVVNITGLQDAPTFKFNNIN